MRSIAVALLLCAASSQPNFRPPAVPLAVSTPFASVWSFDASNLATQTYFWDGYTYSLDALVRVDGKTFTVMGAPALSAPVATQEGFPYVASTSSWYSFVAGGVRLQLRFTTPHLPENLEVAARPATYVVFNASSADGAAHSVQVYLDTTAEVVCAGPGQAVEWDRPALPGGLLALRLGQVGQKEGAFNYSAALRNSTEPHQRQNYGWVRMRRDVLPGSMYSRLPGRGGVAESVRHAPPPLLQLRLPPRGPLQRVRCAHERHRPRGDLAGPVRRLWRAARRWQGRRPALDAPRVEQQHRRSARVGPRLRAGLGGARGRHGRVFCRREREARRVWGPLILTTVF